jgi:Tfp pilus assembly protein PilN
MSLNLAAKPFVNRRPVQRISALCWVLALVLAGVNGYLYWDYFSGQGVTESGLQEVVREFEEETQMLARAREQVAGLEAEELNAKIEFVNQRIQQRTFSWSRLFDVFAATLPDDVRLSNLMPRFDKASTRGSSRARAVSPAGVRIEVQGQAKSSTALLEFLDRLFAHPAFENPDLRQEARSEQDIIEFSISTDYLTDAPDPAQPASDEPETATDSPPEASPQPVEVSE